jgi:acetyl esterase/lipase
MQPEAPMSAPPFTLVGLDHVVFLVDDMASEVLFDDSTRFDAAARTAGVEVTLEPWDDMIHVWHMMAGLLPEGQQAIERIGQWLCART